jgi:hypothetical protein
MNLFNSVITVFQIIKQLLNFIFAKVEESQRKKETQEVDDLKEKVKEDTKKGNIPDLNKNIKI